MDRKQRLVKNSFYNLLGLSWQRLLSFAVLPFVVRHLGADAYGILSFSGALMGYFAISDLGLGEALIKYLSEHYALNDHKRLSSDFWTATIYYTLAGIIIGGVIFFVSKYLVTSVMAVPKNLTQTAILILKWSAAGFALNMAISALVAVPRALQRYDISNKLALFVGTVNSVGMFVLVYLGYGALTIVWLNVASAVLMAVLHYIIFRALLPDAATHVSVEWSAFSRLVGYGAWTLVSRVSAIIMWEIDKFFIVLFLPIEYVTYYTIPLGLVFIIQVVCQSLTSVLTPAASEIHALAQKETLHKLYLRSSLYIGLTAMFMCVMLWVWADKLLLFWMGSEFMARGAWTCRLLIIPIGLSAITGPTFFITNGMGRPDINTKFGLFTAIINLPLSYYLISRYGIVGAPLAMAIPVVPTVPVYVWFVNRKLMDMKMWDYLKKALAPPVLVGAALAIAATLARPLISSLLVLLIGGTVLALFYFLLCYFSGAILAEEKTLIHDVASRWLRPSKDII